MLLLVHGAVRGTDQPEIRRAVILPAGVSIWHENAPPPMFDTVRDELHQTKLSSYGDEIAALILRW
jgi:hypothetical protein